MKLEAKLSRAQFFEMEAWSGITVCTQLTIVNTTGIASYDSVGSSSSADDPCLVALNRLKSEASVHPMKNINALGKQVVSSSGVAAPSSLTRAVIDNAITIRLWVLDLMHAKLARERSAFLEVSLL